VGAHAQPSDARRAGVGGLRCRASAPPAPVFGSIEAVEIGDAPEDWERQHDELVEKVRPLFAGIYPGVQGSVLSYFTALWIVGHQTDEEGHEALLGVQIAAIRSWLAAAREEIEAIKSRMGANLQ
jgi:hypothetical protein